MYLLYLMFFFVLVFFVAPYLILVTKVTGNLKDSFKELVKGKNLYIPYSSVTDKGLGKGINYAPHPYTNWSLNPAFVNSKNEKVHTVEGFRRTASYLSIGDQLNSNKESFNILCVGGSTTYCTEIDNGKDTWPHILQDTLNEKNVQVFNFGVPHFTTIQSLIRLTQWIERVHPDLVIFYQAKNDLNLLTNMPNHEKRLFPDFQNVIGQFSQTLMPRFPKILYHIPLFKLLEIVRLKRVNFHSLYNTNNLDIDKIDKFITDDIVNGIVFRSEAIINICRMSNAKVLYIPEIVRGGVYRRVLYEQVYPKVFSMLKKYKDSGVELFELRGVMPESDSFYFDKMHFNHEGCKLFSSIVLNKIKKDYLN